MRHTFFHLGLLTAGLLVLAGCVPAGVTDPPAVLTKGAACSSTRIACYDELAHEPQNLICFRPTSRWNRTTLTWRLVNPLSFLDEADQIDGDCTTPAVDMGAYEFPGSFPPITIL